jgi:hypothetical protein
MGYIVSLDSLNFSYCKSWKHEKLTLKREEKILFIVSEHFSKIYC